MNIFEISTTVIQALIMTDIIVLIISCIWHIKKYCHSYIDETGRRIYTTQGSPKNRVAKICLFFLPILAILFGLTCFISGISQDAGFENKEFVLGWAFAIAIFAYLMMMLPVFFVKAIVNAVGKHQENIAKEALKVQQQSENNKAKTLDLLKAKYRPIKCGYCGSMNSPERSNCKNCAGILKNEDNRLLE